MRVFQKALPNKADVFNHMMGTTFTVASIFTQFETTFKVDPSQHTQLM
jgi:hypothetical protein